MFGFLHFLSAVTRNVKFKSRVFFLGGYPNGKHLAKIIFIRNTSCLSVSAALWKASWKELVNIPCSGDIKLLQIVPLIYSSKSILRKFKVLSGWFFQHFSYENIDNPCQHISVFLSFLQTAVQPLFFSCLFQNEVSKL